MWRVAVICGTFMICAITATSGWLHAKIYQGARVQAKLKAVGQRLQSMPETSIGPWKFDSNDPIRDEAAEMLEASGYISRTYLHSTEGWRVRVFVGVGPYGPMSVHTPEVCYPANDFTITSKSKQVTVRDSAQEKHALWEMHLKSNDPSGERLQTLYGWSVDGTWAAPKWARFGYIGSPYLYKMQVVSLNESDSDGKADRCQQFLSDFAPVLRKYMND